MAQPKPHTQTYIPMERTCDLCHRVAYADARLAGGGWAFVCHYHFTVHGCKLGLGCGQELIVGERPRSDDDDIRREVADALGVSEDEIDI